MREEKMGLRKRDTGLELFLERTLPLIAERSAGDPSPPQITPLAGDGSTRALHRILSAGTSVVAVVNPLPTDRQHPDENEAFFAVRNFLHQRKLRVPALYAADLEHGFLLLEDLGDLRLHDIVRRTPDEVDSQIHLYNEAVDLLVKMQSPAGPAYDPGMTSNRAYTEEFILRHASGYFHAELVNSLAGLDLALTEIAAECGHLAQLA